MILLELFNSIYKYSYRGSSTDGYLGAFKTDEDHQVEVNFYPNSYQNTDDFWEVEFGRWVSTAGDNKYGVNSRGDAYKIFSTVIQLLLKMIGDAQEPEWVMFVAKEDSRKKLYGAFAKRFTQSGTYKRVTSGKMHTAIKQNYKTDEVFLFYNYDYGDPS